MNPKYFKPCLVEFHDGEIIEGFIAKDGLTLSFSYCVIARRLNKIYPTHNFAGWFFNQSKDRFVAERFGDEVSVNPQFVWQHAKEIVS